MVVLGGSDRFGMAQLHQLKRSCRTQRPSQLVRAGGPRRPHRRRGGPPSGDGRQLPTDSELAEVDLDLRGEGDGARRAPAGRPGDPGLASLRHDRQWVEVARRALRLVGGGGLGAHPRLAEGARRPARPREGSSSSHDLRPGLRSPSWGQDRGDRSIPSDRPARTRALVWVLVVVATIATIAVVVVFAGDDEPTSAPVNTPVEAPPMAVPDTATTRGRRPPSSTAPTAWRQGGDPGPGRASGTRPAVGQTFTGASDSTSAAASGTAGGFARCGVGDVDRRHRPVPGDPARCRLGRSRGRRRRLMELIGVDLSTGRVTFPATTTPAQFRSTASWPWPVPPRTRLPLRFGRHRGPGVWVYSADAVRTGEGVMAVEGRSGGHADRTGTAWPGGDGDAGVVPAHAASVRLAR